MNKKMLISLLRQKARLLMVEISDLKKEIDNFRADPDDFGDEYDELLNEFGPVKIGSLKYDAAHVLKLVDPVAYRCGLIDYTDAIDPEGLPDYIALIDRREELQNQYDEILNDLREAENAE